MQYKYSALLPEDTFNDIRFYKSFNENFLFSKVSALKAIIELSEGLSGADKVTTSFLEDLRAEIYFTIFMQFESLFALMMAPFQPKPHGLYMTLYQSGKLRKQIYRYVKQDIDLLTGGKERSSIDFINHALFCKVSFKSSDEGSLAFKNSLVSLDNFLKMIASLYLTGSERGAEYNTYKHGVRFYLGYNSFKISEIGASDEDKVGFETQDSITYSKTEKIDSETIYVSEGLVHFDWLESYQAVRVMASCLETLKKVRISVYSKSEYPKIPNFAVHLDGLFNNFITPFRMG